MTTITEPLTSNDVIYMAEVINHMFATGKVRVLVNDRIVEGLLRHFCGEDLDHRVGDDVRGWYVRITTTSGLEMALPLTELAHKRQVGECALDPGMTARKRDNTATGRWMRKAVAYDRLAAKAYHAGHYREHERYAALSHRLKEQVYRQRAREAERQAKT